MRTLRANDELQRLRELQVEGEEAWLARTNWLGPPLEPFEGWLIERWINQMRTGRFRETRQYQRMVQAYERERGL